MIVKSLRLLFAVGITIYCFSRDFAYSQTNGFLMQVYTGINGTSVADLTNAPSFPGSPAFEDILTNYFEIPVNWGDNYGTRVIGLIVPPVTGNYVFWISSDDNSILYLSTDSSPLNKRAIASVNNWTSSREWEKEANQKSAPIRLTNGVQYYIEALQKEGGGGDNLAVGWQLPDGTLERPIPAHRGIPFGLGAPVITKNPQNASVVEGGTAIFIVELARYLGARFQWFKDGFPIQGANTSSNLFGPAKITDNNSTFFCLVSNDYGVVTSSVAKLTVIPDTTPPKVLSAGSLGSLTMVSVYFSEPLDPATATNAENYTLNRDAVVLSARFGINSSSIILTTTPLTPRMLYTLTVNNIKDCATVPNVIATNSKVYFRVDYMPLETYKAISTAEPLGPSSRRSPIVVSEVMYHPKTRSDGRNLEFIEIYNSQPWFEDISGWKITGSVNFTFPTNTIIGSNAFLVVAANPDDLKAVYGITNIIGKYEGDLPNGSGKVQIRNNLGAVLFDMEYSDEPPFPLSADGVGHSLVLSRPSYGERDPRAWSQSVLIGGSPGKNEQQIVNQYFSIMINEVFINEFMEGYIELFNYHTTSVSIAGIIITDDPETNKFIVPTPTYVPSFSFIKFSFSQLGFNLNPEGGKIIIKNPGDTFVIDSLKYPAIEPGVSYGRFPDGAPEFSRLQSPTIGTNNADILFSDVVINEIMYDPATENKDDEYLEIYNRSTNWVNIGKWRIRGGISYTFPANTLIPPDGYYVVARNKNRLLATHPQLDGSLVFGDFDGSLSNDGERLTLDKPITITVTNEYGMPTARTIRVVVDEVSYKPGGRWGKWSNGGGSSLERIDPAADGRFAYNWADSDETQKSQWTVVEHTGVLDHGNGDASAIDIIMMGPGECLIDDVEVIPAGGNNLVENPNFENGISGWLFQGTHCATTIENGTGVNGSKCIHVRASARGDTGANRIRGRLTSGLSSGTTATLRAKVRWLKGSPQILLRLKGNWLEAPGNILTTADLGTPGRPNSRKVLNAGPAIADVSHYPIVPVANVPVTVYARVYDPDGLASLVLQYRIDPSTNYTPVSMVNRGAGWYSGTIPAQTNGTIAAFYIEALDGNEFSPALTRFPDDAPERECVIRWGDTVVNGKLGVYRVWLTQKIMNKWIAREKLSNDPLDVTFVYGSQRVIYNAGAQYSGSPYHSPGYNSPIGNNCDYVISFGKDDLFLGEKEINLLQPGNGGGDSTLQAEQQAYWIAGKMGLPTCYRRSIHLFINGVRRGMLFEDAQQPNSDFVEEWYPNDPDGDLYKVQLWFEFDDMASSFSAVGADLSKYLTTGGVKKLARYRWNWAKRAYGNDAHNYTNIFNLVDIVNTSATGENYTRTIQSAIDVEQWFKTHVVEHIVGNNDSYSYGGGQNMYAYKPERGLWNLLIWDIDFAFFSMGPTTDMFGIGGANKGPKNSHPPFARIYWQAMIQAANGPLRADQADTILDARYNAFRADGINPTSPQSIKNYIATRREYILGLVASNNAPFTITSNSGNDFSTNRNLIVLTGTAPLEVRTIAVNGTPYDAIWTTLSNWTIRVQLKPGENRLNIQGIDFNGNAVSNASASINVQFTGIDESPEGKVVINEIMYNPPVQGASYIEIYNASTNNAFDLSNWRLEGVDFQFAPGTIIEPNSYLVVVKDAVQFAAAYGATIPVAGEFSGTLKNEGETIKLIKPGSTPSEDVVISAVTYSPEPPWSQSANGYGSSLQLIDANQDNSRIINWTAAYIDTNFVPQTLISMTDIWKYNQTADLTGSGWQNIYYDDSSWQSGAALLYVENASLPAPKNTPLTLGRTTYYFRKKFVFDGNPNGVTLRIYTIIDDGAVIYLNGNPIYSIRMSTTNPNYSTLASTSVGDATLEGPFDVPATYLVRGTNVIAVEVHQNSTGSSDIVFGMSLETRMGNIAIATPGSKNSVATTLPPIPQIWLNEVQPHNFNTIADSAAEFDPWVEIYNSSTNPISLNNFFLSDDLENLTKWKFPTNLVINPKSRLIIFLDGQTEQSNQDELHANFRINPERGMVLLSAIYGGGTNLIDYLSWKMAGVNRSYGSYPEGTAADRRLFYIPTPCEPNNPTIPPINVFINEWMADNTGTIADPADGDFEDWFEIYNPSNTPVNLEGYYLTDNLNQKTQFKIPAGFTLPANGFLLVWADGEPNQNSPTRTDLHVNFRLSADGEAIGLFAPDGTLVDSVTFGKQSADVSMGRFPDGSNEISVFTNATPGKANMLIEPNLPPIIKEIGNKVVVEGETIVIQVEVSDPNRERQNLYFSLEDGAPQGAYIDPITGIFTWTPSEVYGGESYPITIRVTDNGYPPLSATQSFTISVEKTNSPPVIVIPPNQVVNEGEMVSFIVTAVDTDLPPQAMRFSLGDDAPEGASINPTNGQFSWVPSENQGPGIYAFFIYVHDDGEPQMSDARRITITVNEVNQPPVFVTNLNQTNHVGCIFDFIIPVNDPDLPANKLYFNLLGGSEVGAVVEQATGVFKWNPGSEFRFTTNKFTVVVTDDGEPPLSATNSFTIVLLDELKVDYVLTETNYFGLKWNSIPNHHYRIEYKDKFSQQLWIHATESYCATNSFMEVYLPIQTNISRFYRVISTP